MKGLQNAACELLGKTPPQLKQAAAAQRSPYVRSACAHVSVIQKGPLVISLGASGKYYQLMDFDKDHLHRAVVKYAAVGEVAMKFTPPADLQDYKSYLAHVVHARGPRTTEV